MNLSKIKILDKWTPTTLIEQKITKIFKDEDYKNTN